MASMAARSLLTTGGGGGGVGGGGGDGHALPMFVPDGTNHVLFFSVTCGDAVGADAHTRCYRKANSHASFSGEKGVRVGAVSEGEFWAAPPRIAYTGKSVRACVWGGGGG